MKRALLGLTLATGLLSLSLTAGCQRGVQYCPCSPGARVYVPEASGPLPTVVSRLAAAGVELSPEGPSPVPLVLPSRPPPRDKEAPAVEPPPELVPPPAPEKPAAEEQPAAQVEPTLPPVTEPLAPAGPGHAPDHSWLIGRLQYVHVRDAWRIRYAPTGDDDPYGGVVTLIDPGPMTAYRSGQMVRVEGRVLEPDSREPSPSYQVKSIQPAP